MSLLSFFFLLLLPRLRRDQTLGESGHTVVDLWANHTPATGRNGTYVPLLALLPTCSLFATPGFLGESYSTFLYGDEAVRVVRDHAPDKPLFMYYAFQVRGE
jgi:hypothetical protein